MRVALTAGGTGGHIFPALAVYDALAAQGGVEAVRFFGPDRRGERSLVASRGVGFETVDAAAVRGRGPFALAKSLVRLCAGTIAATRRLRAFQPDVVFSTGGYASFPASLAARLLRRPLVVYLPDVTPGWAVRVEKRLATRMATTAEAALDHLPRGKTVVTGYPVRAAFFEMTRAQARDLLNIAAGEKVLLVAGASQGSQTLNRALFDALPKLTEQVAVFHVTGKADFPEAERLRDELSAAKHRYVPSDFRDDLPTVMLAADLGVMRAGASTLGELPAASLPAVMIPGTFAGGHQRDNAAWLATEGAAVVVDERHIATLAERALALLEDEAKLTAMREAAGRLAVPDAAARIAALVREVAQR